MDKRTQQVITEARDGDLRPQVNPHALLASAQLPADLQALEPVLVDRLFQLSRPIADARTQTGADLRVRDAGHFFYLIETLARLGYPRLEELLLIVLDEFAQLTEKSYDELYLWCIVQLSRTDLRHVCTFWPQVIALDMRYRSAPWQRPQGSRVFEQPYRLTDLLFYYYVGFTLGPIRLMLSGRSWTAMTPYPSLLACLTAIAPGWTPPAKELILRALRQLAEDEPNRQAYRDALGYLSSKGALPVTPKPGPGQGV
jgi:hypothetical protein